MKPRVDAQLQARYDVQYGHGSRAWRELGGRFKAERILELTEGMQLGKVLDCGAGEGAVLGFLAAAGRFGELFAVEISDTGLAQIQRRDLPGLVEAVKFDGYRIPYGDKAFDLAIASHVVEHVEHPRMLLRELARVSRYQLLEVPLEYAPGFEGDVAAKLELGHINVYSPSTFRFLLATEGLEIMREKLSKTPRHVVRYNWYHNQKRRFSPLSEARLLASPLIQQVRRVLRGRARHEEGGYDAFTALTRATGEGIGGRAERD